jgi:hypothetical protein
MIPAALTLMRVISFTISWVQRLRWPMGVLLKHCASQADATYSHNTTNWALQSAIAVA